MRYLNRRFVQITLGFLAIVALSLLIIAAVSAYAAGVEQIVFTTPSQTVKPNEISDIITIQTQDADGNLLQTPETIDLVFTSSSATGEFLGSSGNPATTYMKEKTANRNFYYRDSSAGTFTISVNAVGRESGLEWSASQEIIVSDSAENLPDDDSSGEVLGAETSSMSATSGYAPPSYSTPTSQLEVSIGGDRLTAPGSPISFQAHIKKNTSSNESLRFSWSFGDGHVGEGALVTHMYKYPGDYAVVLNARSGNIFAIGRLKVKVVKPDISLSSNGEYVEITNLGNTEINLFNWKVTDGHQSFIFQPDTIILPKSSIKVDKSMFRMKSSDNPGLSLKNFMGETVTASAWLEAAQTQKSALTEIIPESFYLAQTAAKAPEPENVEEERSENLREAPHSAGLIFVAASDEEATAESEQEILYEVPKEKGLLTKIWTFLASMLP